MEAEKSYFFRPYSNSDVNFIQNSWAQSYYGGDGFKQSITPLEFNSHHRPYRESFFQRSTATVIVCAYKEGPDVILGWMAVEERKTNPGIYLHYIYVKHSFQRLGIAKELLSHILKKSPIFITHLTLKADRIIDCHDEVFSKFYYEPIQALEQIRGKNGKVKRTPGKNGALCKEPTDRS